MANIIQIKRSAFNGQSAPTNLEAGEFAWLQGPLGGSGSRRLYIGRSTDNSGGKEIWHLSTLDDLTAGDGLAITAAGGSNDRDRVLSVNVDGSGIELSSDTLQLKADGVKDTHIDWGSGSGQINTTDIPEGSNLWYTDERVDDRLGALATAGEGIDITYDDAGGTLTFTGEDATVSNKGVASFATANFSVTSGAVSSKDVTLTSDSGSAAATIGETFTIAGGEGIDTSATGTTLTIVGENASATNKGVAKFNSTRFAVTAGAVDIASDGITMGTHTNGNYVASLVAGTGITLANNTGETATPTVSIGQAIGTGDSPTFAALTVTGDVRINGNDIQNSDGEATITMDAAQNVTIAADLQIGGNDIKASNGTVAISLSDNDVTVQGNLTVEGDTVTNNVATLTVEDPLIKLAKGNTSGDTVDLGIFGEYNDGGGVEYSGLFRDASDGDGIWVLFDSLTSAHWTDTATTVDTTAGSFDFADLKLASLTGADNSGGNGTLNTFTIDGGSF